MQMPAFTQERKWEHFKALPNPLLIIQQYDAGQIGELHGCQ